MPFKTTSFWLTAPPKHNIWTTCVQSFFAHSQSRVSEMIVILSRSTFHKSRSRDHLYTCWPHHLKLCPSTTADCPLKQSPCTLLLQVLTLLFTDLCIGSTLIWVYLLFVLSFLFLFYLNKVIIPWIKSSLISWKPSCVTGSMKTSSSWLERGLASSGRFPWDSPALSSSWSF